MEIVMFTRELRSLAARLFHSNASATAPDVAQPTPNDALFEPDPTWHGDHWQNLLSSPIDARRYVMEDWCLAAEPEFSAAGSVGANR